MKGITGQSTPQRETLLRPVGDPTAGPATGLSSAWLAVYLGAYELWRQLAFLRHPYSFVFLRLLFLGGIAVALWRLRDLRSFFGYIIGRVRLGRAQYMIAAVMLVVTVAARMAIECFWPCVKRELNLREFADNVLIAPINEEMVFRGVFLGILLRQPGWNQMTAVLVATVAFAGTHEIAGATGLLRLMTLGLVTGLAYVKTRSVPVCILCHMTWNLAACCPFIHPGKVGETWYFYIRQ